jgi:uncharacterized protein (DUF58 family)
MTRRGRLALALGVATYLVARIFGSTPLYPVAVGLGLAVGAGWVVVRLAQGPIRLRREITPTAPTEGDDVLVSVRVERERPVTPPSLALVERVAKLGERRTPIRHDRGAYLLPALPRGRYVFERARAVIEDPFGLDRAETTVEAPSALLVYPRIVELERVFSETGALSHDGRRLLLRRPSGFDLHSVREYEQGESLRKVHWRSTAKRGELMVKELEDAPRDEIAVLLDGHVPVVGESFDVQVRAAGSILHAHARRGRRAVLVVNDAQRHIQRVHTVAGDWRQALDLLAAVEPTAKAPAAALLGEESGAVSRALEVTVVTASLDDALVDRLLQRSLAQRRAALVYVDLGSFGVGGGARQPRLLRLASGGVPVAVLRRGDDLAEKLAGDVLRRAAHG